MRCVVLRPIFPIRFDLVKQGMEVLIHKPPRLERK